MLLTRWLGSLVEPHRLDRNTLCRYSTFPGLTLPSAVENMDGIDDDEARPVAGQTTSCNRAHDHTVGSKPKSEVGFDSPNPLRRFRCPALFFYSCCVVVALVSIHDAALIVFNHSTINELEENPVGRWLLQLHGGEVWLFVLAKLAGTALVCAILVTAYQNRKWHMIPIVGALAIFQLSLLCYLTFA